MKNNFEIKGSIVEIDCKRNNGDIVKTIISIEDFDKVSSYQGTWIAGTNNRSNKIYILGNLPDKDGRRMVLLHRVVSDAPKGLVVNHKSGNTLDNTRENLEVITHQENVIHGKQQIDVVVRKSKREPFTNWYEVIWKVEGHEIMISIHSTKAEALVKKMTFEARQRPERLVYTDYQKRFKELGYDWSLVPFEFEYGEHIPKIMIGRDIHRIKVKRSKVK